MEDPIHHKPPADEVPESYVSLSTTWSSLCLPHPHTTLFGFAMAEMPHVKPIQLSSSQPPQLFPTASGGRTSEQIWSVPTFTSCFLLSVPPLLFSGGQLVVMGDQHQLLLIQESPLLLFFQYPLEIGR